MRSVLLALPLALLAGIAVAQDWGLIANISSTMGNHANRLCVGEGLRPTDIGCPTYAPSLTTAGDLIVSGTVSATRFVGDGSGLINLSASGDRIVSGTLSMLAISNTGYISLSTAGVNWGYFSSGLSYLPTLSATTVGVSNSLTYAGQVVQTVAGGGGDYIISGSASVSTSSANGGTIKMGNSSGLVMTISGSLVGIGTSTPNYFLTVNSNNSQLRLDNSSGGQYSELNFANAGTAKGNIFWDQVANLLIAGTDVSAPIVFKTNSSQRMRIDSSGNVGIGTTAPSTFLEVGAGSTDGDGAYTAFFNQSVDGLFGTIVRRGGVNNPQELIFGVNQSGLYSTIQASQGHISVDSLVLQPAGGNVGIGTTSPTEKLTIASAAAANVLSRWYQGGVVEWWAGTLSGSDKFQIGYGSGTGTPRITIDNAGSVGIGTTAPGYTLHVNGSVAGTSAYNNLSDRRFKKDITPAEYGLATVEKLRPVTFNWIKPTNQQMVGRQLGLIAQEVQPLVPEAVSVANDPSHTMSIAYSTLVPVLIKAVQQLKADNDNMRAEDHAAFEALRRELNELKASRK